MDARAKGVLGQYVLETEIGRLDPAAIGVDRRAETLVKTDRMRVVLVTMRPEAALHEHVAPGPITIQALRGRFTVTIEDERRDLPAGSLIVIDAHVRHAVHAVEDGAFLLTIGWPPEEAR
ncbi:MAG: cupin domain-containing protein, partial [Thermomicrobiaceae bacterium]|nr:cupin domain-containing protein [Thermomicrobiaceae bacterium]